ncbi:RHS repeat-associated core domain-containing protein [Luteimonas sp. RD2P54]|uniref:RHS repeat-associated core domain-containing protein n=1 Tax=Luteimonas endophytica TaxID=3042023 RepID=A0ABT6J521_9GAMM|nr:RHS repeat-associated core domain-containing protein [Luteimonas endophytica]MDH5821904.1 RHS repeat-associated core domain-containing protein [Luteimonas endophytica]
MKDLVACGATLLLVVLALCLMPVGAAFAQTTVKYIHTDALGSVVAVTDQNRNVLERREYEPYGPQLTPALADGPGYTGHVQDAATGLTYMQQRYYDPALGVLLSVDPVTAYDTGDMRLFSRYAYAANNPYKFTDPDGRLFDVFLDIGFAAYSAYVLAKDPSWTNAAALGADVGAAVVPGVTGAGVAVRAGADAASAAAPILGRAQVTKAGGQETAHASTSQRIASEQSARTDAVSVHLNQRVSTVTGGEAQSAVRPDVATLRQDGKVDVMEVLSPGQNAGASAQKYSDALGDRAGTIQCVPQDSC